MRFLNGIYYIRRDVKSIPELLEDDWHFLPVAL